jgi:hypothetical protein
MECGIEYGHLRDTRAKELTHRQNTPDVIGIVKGRQIDTVLDSLEHAIVNESRFLEQLTAMHHAMSDRVDVSHTVNFRDTGSIRCHVANQVFQGPCNISQRRCESLIRLVSISKMDNCLAPDALNLTATDAIILVLLDPVEVGGNDLKLQTGTSRVENQNVHPCIL